MNSLPETDFWNLPLLRELEWRRFETLCARVFEKIGYDVWATDPGSDGDINLIVSSPNPADGGSRTAMCCRSFEGIETDLEAIRELKGAVAERGFGNGIFITTGDFSPQAREFAGSNPELVLIDGREFLAKLIGLPKETRQELLEAVTEGDYTTPTCPSCGLMMARRLATRGGIAGSEFWTCPDIGPQSCRKTFPVLNGAGAPRPDEDLEPAKKSGKRRIRKPGAAKPAFSLREMIARRFGLQGRTDSAT